MTRYPLERVGSLLLTKAAVSGPAGVKVIRLLIDTGSVYTVLPVEVLESIGCSPAVSPDHVRLVTGNGYIIAAQVRVRSEEHTSELQSLRHLVCRLLLAK